MQKIGISTLWGDLAGPHEENCLVYKTANFILSKEIKIKKIKEQEGF